MEEDLQLEVVSHIRILNALTPLTLDPRHLCLVFHSDFGPPRLVLTRFWLVFAQLSHLDEFRDLYVQMSDFLCFLANFIVFGSYHLVLVYFVSL